MPPGGTHEIYRLEYRSSDGAAAELMSTADLTTAVATATSWADWLGRTWRGGVVAVVDGSTGDTLRSFPVATGPDDHDLTGSTEHGADQAPGRWTT